MLSQIELRLFKCFDLLKLRLSPLTLLTGLNASGKSTILQALALLQQTIRGHEWSTKLILNGISVRLGTTLDVVDELFGRNRIGLTLEADEHTYGWDFVGERRDMSMHVERVWIDGSHINNPQTLRHLLPLHDNNFIVPFVDSLRNLSYITAERVSPQETYRLEDRYTVDSVGPRGEHTMSVLYWGRDDPTLNELRIPQSAATQARQVEQHMRTLFPGLRLELRHIPRTNSITLRLRISDESNYHSPIQTGFGLTQILPILVAVLSAKKGSIVLIENPEIHLHPAGQARVGEFLAEAASAGIQVILETHSDHVLNGVRRAVKEQRLAADNVAIHFFQPRSNTGPQVTSPLMDKSGNIDDWPDGFFDQFDKDTSYFAGWS